MSSLFLSARAAPHLRSTTSHRVRTLAHLYAGACVVIVLALLAALGWASPAGAELSHRILASGIVALGTAPLVVYLLRFDPEEFPLLPLHGLFYVLMFGLPVLSPHNVWRGAPSSAVETALTLTLSGIVVLFLGYAFGRYVLFANVEPVKLPQAVHPRRLALVAFMFLGAHLAYRYVPALQSVPSVGQFLILAAWTGITILFSMYLRGTLSRLASVAFWGGAMPLVVLSRLASGSLADSMLVAVILGVIYWQERKRLPVVFVLVAAVTFVVLHPVKHEYRAKTWGDRAAEVSTFGKVSIFADVVVRHYQREGVAGLLSSKAYVDRLSNISIFAKVVHDTPSRVPYWNGETYRALLTSMIPRALYPDKPPTAFGNTFGHRYRFIAPDDFHTAINLPWLVEFYANFGAWGVVIGMTIVGIVFAFLMRKLGRAGTSPGQRAPQVRSHDANAGILARAFGMTVIFGLFLAESNLAQMWGGLILAALTFYVAIRVLTLRP